MTVHPESTETTTPDSENQPDESTAWTDPDAAAEPNPAGDPKSTDRQPAATDRRPAADQKSTSPKPAAGPQPPADGQPSSEEKSPEPGPPTEARSATASTTADVGPAPAVSRERDSGPGDDADVGGGGDPLLSRETRLELGSRWSEIQANFVDHPQGSVQEADALVVDLMQRVTGSLSNERERLESQWRQGDHVSTEDLRVALTRYRSFFDRLLSA